MPEFRSKWLEKLTETPKYGGNKRNKSPCAASATAILERSEENPEALSESALLLMERLRKGGQWLTEQHCRWLREDPIASADDKFGHALASWTELEQVFRCTGYEGCIFGPDQRCPEDAPLTCDCCVGVKHSASISPPFGTLFPTVREQG